MNHITELKISFGNEPVGSLIWYDRHFWFQYDAYWLQQGFDLAPQFLTFDSQPQLAKQPTFQGLHGAFYDSLPDGWGLLLMDRFFKKEFSWDTQEVKPLDRLAYMGKRAMGALEYEPAIANEHINENVNLVALVENAEKILAGNSQVVLNQLRILGGSPAGARPKVTVALADHSDDCIAGLKHLPDGYKYYLIKFRGQNDPSDIGRLEKAYAELAKNAGLEVAPSRLVHIKHQNENEELFAVQRFDRENSNKLHMLTLGGYLYADFRMPSLDYHAFFAATAMLTKDTREIERAFRLMIFNVATHNKDDHVKNFSYICDRSGVWRLSPAYDLTFSQGYNNEHSTSINGSGNPTKKDFAVLAESHAIQNWEAIVEEVLSAVAGWDNVAKKYKVTKPTITKISKVIKEIALRLSK